MAASLATSNHTLEQARTNADSRGVGIAPHLMTKHAATAVLATVLSIVPAAAQDAPSWLAGTWTELARARAAASGKGQQRKTAAEPPLTVQAAIGSGIVRIVEDGADGQDLRCRLDGTELAYKQTKKDATLDYTLQCEVGPQSLEMTGLFTVGAVEGFPPREFELQKTYELAPDGSLRRHDRVWAIIPGIGRVPLSDASVSFARTR
jgi:hypothetical protein